MSTTIDPVVLQQLVAQAVRQLQKEGNQPVVSDISDVPDEYGVFTTMSDAINASESAQHMPSLSVAIATTRNGWM